MPRKVNMSKQQDKRRQATQAEAPLAEIRLKNFKSVTDATVELRPLSVVVGRNSSGKSTLLQSVLAMAQAVRNKSNSRQFPLNGEYVRLGTFGEVLSFQNINDNPEISIGFTVDSRSPRFRASNGARNADEQHRISWTGHLTAPEELSNGFVTLAAFELGISTKSDSIQVSQVSLDVSSVGDSNQVFLSVEGRIVNLTSGKSSRVDAVEISGVLPLLALRREAQFDVYARQWWDLYNGVLEDEVNEQKSKIGEQTAEGKQVKVKLYAIEVAAADLIEAHEFAGDPARRAKFVKGKIRNPDMSYPESQFVRRYLRLTEKQRASVAASIASLGEASFNARLKKKLVEQTWVNNLTLEAVADEVSGNLWATRSAESLFSNLQYLGPLRESPQVLYNPGPSRIDLGTKGEYTAAVLHAHQNDEYMVPLPDGSVRSTRLGDALNLWLAELGLADEGKATDRGRLGIGLTVSPVGSGKDVDLTSVGVGVSQVLPVLLLCLLARRGTVVLMEQPELHLHPAMQLRLADFLLACARSGRQIMIETHSEHLVNRLRLHVAQDETSATSDLVQLLFAEQENGVTSYRTSQINPLGGLSEDWPRGFLDVGSDEAGQLLRQTVLRQRQISSKKD